MHITDMLDNTEPRIEGHLYSFPCIGTVHELHAREVVRIFQCYFHFAIISLHNTVRHTVDKQ